MASPLLVPVLVRLAATPWYLGGSFTEDALAILTHTGWQFTLLAYHTLSLLREPALFAHSLLMGWLAVRKYGLPDVPLPRLSETTLSVSSSRPRISILGQWFEPQLLFSPSSRLVPPQPIASLLGWASPLPSPSGLRLLPCSPPPPLPPLPGSSSPSVWLFQVSLEFDISWTVRWWSLADLVTPTPPKEGPLLLPGYYEQWKQYYQMSKFFSQLFAGGHMPIG